MSYTGRVNILAPNKEIPGAQGGFEVKFIHNKQGETFVTILGEHERLTPQEALTALSEVAYFIEFGIMGEK